MLIEFVLQMNILIPSPSTSFQSTVNVILLPDMTGSGLSVADVIVGGAFSAAVTVTVAVPEVYPEAVAVIVAVPADDEVNVTVQVPDTSVVQLGPTVPRLVENETVTPD